jgi:hypothetical protein
MKTLHRHGYRSLQTDESADVSNTADSVALMQYESVGKINVGFLFCPGGMHATRRYAESSQTMAGWY